MKKLLLLLTLCSITHLHALRDIDNNLIYYAFQGNKTMVSIMLSQGAYINSVEAYGNTPLIAGCIKGNVTVVDHLLQSGALVNTKNKEGATALYLASQLGHTAVVEKLLQKNADVTIKTTALGSIPLHVATQNGHLEVAQLLLKYGSPLDAQKTNYGQTPLMLACIKGYTNMVDYLLRSGANVNVQGPKGMAALHLAAGEGHSEITKLLLDHGASTLAIMDGWGTPLDIAEKTRQYEIVQLLSNYKRQH